MGIKIKYIVYVLSTFHFWYSIDGSAINGVSLTSITESSSNDDVQELVIKLGNGVLDVGVSEILTQFGETASDILDKIEDTLKEENVDQQCFARIGKSANRLLNTNMGPNYGVDFLTSIGKNEKIFDSNTTNFLLDSYKLWSKFATDMQDADSVDSDTKLAICICTLDYLIKFFQDSEDDVTSVLNNLLGSNFIILTDDLITTYIKFRKDVISFMQKTPAIVNTGASYIADAKSGKYKGKDTEGTLKDLQASQYRDAQDNAASKSIKNVKDKLNGQQISYSNLSDAMQQNNENLLYTQLRKLSLSNMAAFLGGTKSIASSKILEKFKKDHSDAQSIISKVEDVSTQTSTLWLNALMSNLKRQICIINNKNMDDYFQLGSSTMTDFGTTLEQVHKAFSIAFDIPVSGEKDDKSKDDGKSEEDKKGDGPKGGGKSGEDKKGDGPKGGGKSGEDKKGDEPKGGGKSGEDKKGDGPKGGGKSGEDKKGDGPKGGGKSGEDKKGDEPKGGGKSGEDKKGDGPKGGGKSGEDKKGDGPKGGGKSGEDKKGDGPKGGGKSGEDKKGDGPKGGGKSGEDKNGDDPKSGGKSAEDKKGDSPKGGGKSEEDKKGDGTKSKDGPGKDKKDDGISSGSGTILNPGKEVYTNSLPKNVIPTQ